jgi:hypothetical protein
LFDGLDLTKASDLAELRKRAQDAFDRTAPTSTNPLTDAEKGDLTTQQITDNIGQIIEWLDKFSPAADALSAALSRTQQEIQIEHITDPVQQFAKQAQDYAAVGGSLSDLLKGFDLTNLSPNDIAAIDE